MADMPVSLTEQPALVTMKRAGLCLVQLLVRPLRLIDLPYTILAFFRGQLNCCTLLLILLCSFFFVNYFATPLFENLSLLFSIIVFYSSSSDI